MKIAVPASAILRRVLAGVLALVPLIVFGLPASSAGAVPPNARWQLRSVAQPTSFEPGDCLNTPENTEDELSAFACDKVSVLVTNVGAKASAGAWTVVDTIPVGLKIVTKFGGSQAVIDGEDLLTNERIPCTVTGQVVECTNSAAILPEDILLFQIAVEVESGTPAGPLTENQVSASGGGALPQSVKNPVVIEQPEPFRLLDFGVEPRTVDGETSQQAGDHPNLVSGSLEIASRYAADLEPEIRKGQPAPPVEYLKDALVYLPLGMVGNPTVLPACPLLTVQLSPQSCPTASRIGTVLFDNAGGYEASIHEEASHTSFLYNVPPEAGFPAEFAFNFQGKPVALPAGVVHLGGVGGGYALRVGSPGIPKVGLAQATMFDLTFWGNPSAHNGGALPREAFLANPTNCSGPLKAKVEVDSWENPGVWSERESIAYPQLQGCEALSFSPSFTMRPEVSSADMPSAYEAVLRIPQNRNISPAIATAQLKDAKVALPEGVSLSPSAANGLAGCAAEGPEGINIGSDNIGHAGRDLGDPEATELGAGHLGGNGSRYDDGIYHTAPGHCPNASQIGTTKISSPLLEEELEGHIYVAKPTCNPCTEADAQNGSLYGIYLEAEAAKAGVIVKLHGKVSADPQTGQLTATFTENPQLPFEELRLKFDGGNLAPLANPQTCGKFEIETDFTPWSTPETPDATPRDSFSIGGGANGGACVSRESQAPNAPSFEAGTTNPLAGTYSPFVLKLNREDGSQRLQKINLTLPPGLTGKLAGIPYCPEAALAAAKAKSGTEELGHPSCPAASEVGTVTVGAGPGTKPFYAHGHAYLAGPYEGAPLSLAIVTPAVAGPFDLGTVVVRSALHVNEETAQITAKSDPIPQILDGTPLDVRSIALELNRSQFTLNPTDCEAMAVGGEAISAAGQSAQLSNRFQVGGCKGLDFKPELGVRLFAHHSNRGAHPRLRAVLTPRAGDANARRIAATLPSSELLENAHIRTICTRVQFAAGAGFGSQCPAGSVYGHVRAWTPLLANPLEGPAYLRSSSHELPDIVLALHGQIDVLAVGRIDSVKLGKGSAGGIRTTFENIPDAPLSRVILDMQGGKKGLLVNSTDICRGEHRALVHSLAHNGRVSDVKPPVRPNGCGK